MLKRFRLYKEITVNEIAQLELAGIRIEMEHDIETMEVSMTYGSKPRYIKMSSVYLHTRNNKQETLLSLILSLDSYQLEEVEDEGYPKFI